MATIANCSCTPVAFALIIRTVMRETERNESQVLTFDYDALRRQLDLQYRIGEYNEKLKALDLVRDMTTPKAARVKTAAVNGSGPSSLKKAVVAILPHLPPEFTNEQIIEAVESRYPRFKPININSLRATIHALKGKALKPVTVGGGSKRTTYERVK